MGVLNPTVLEGLDMLHATCAPACTLFDLSDVHVLSVACGRSSFTLVVETVPSLVGCPACGVLATGHGRVSVLLHDLPCAGVPVRVVWRKRRYRCHETAYEVTTFSEVHELAAPRAKLTTRVISWALGQLRAHDIAVSALAEMLGVTWNTVWNAIAPVIEAQLAAEERLAGVNALGVDEHVWRHVGPPGTGLVTGIVDHSRGEDGRPGHDCWIWCPGARGRPTATGSSSRGRPSRAGSARRRWIRSTATPTPSATSSRRRSPFSTRSTS